VIGPISRDLLPVGVIRVRLVAPWAAVACRKSVTSAAPATNCSTRLLPCRVGTDTTLLLLTGINLLQVQSRRVEPEWLHG
jgi:hypothetical protein